MNSGRIGIYGHNDELLDARQYYSKEGRQTIITVWEQQYFGKASYFQLFPLALDVKEETLQRKKYIRSKAIENDVGVKFERPPSKYSNIESPLKVYSDSKINRYER